MSGIRPAFAPKWIAASKPSASRSKGSKPCAQVEWSPPDAAPETLQGGGPASACQSPAAPPAPKCHPPVVERTRIAPRLTRSRRGPHRGQSLPPPRSAPACALRARTRPRPDRPSSPCNSLETAPCVRLRSTAALCVDPVRHTASKAASCSVEGSNLRDCASPSIPSGNILPPLYLFSSPRNQLEGAATPTFKGSADGPRRYRSRQLSAPGGRARFSGRRAALRPADAPRMRWRSTARAVCQPRAGPQSRDHATRRHRAFTPSARRAMRGWPLWRSLCARPTWPSCTTATPRFRSPAPGRCRGKPSPGTCCLSFAASSDDPISGGRHKVLGSSALNDPAADLDHRHPPAQGGGGRLCDRRGPAQPTRTCPAARGCA